MGIPEELKTMHRWVCYRMKPDPDGGKDRKVPVNPLTGGNAKSNDPTTWTDYETAVDAYNRYNYAGLGFMFVKEDGFVGVDIDHCFDTASGLFNETATAILARQPTYAEFSPSGEGVHLWFRGTKPPGGSKNSTSGVEMYDSVRYFTMTGNQVRGSPDEIATAAPDTLSWIVETYIAKPKKKSQKKKTHGGRLSDEDVIEKAMSADNGDAFAALMAGDWQGKYDSQSEADMALCTRLAFWTGKDREQMDRIFRSSGLIREKWDKQHHADGATYGEETLSRAIEQTERVYSPGGDNPIFEYAGVYFRAKGDGVYRITNFLVHPVEMIRAEEETQLTADFVTENGETHRITFMTAELANQQKFKNLLSKRTISLSWLGAESDLELFKAFLAQMDWVVKDGVKAVGIYSHCGKNVFVTADAAIDASGAPVDDLIQLTSYQSIRTGILQTDPLTVEALKELGPLLFGFNEPAKAVSIAAWTAGCFVKPLLRTAGIKFPHLFLIGEAGSGKSTTEEMVILPIFSTDKVTAATQVTQFTLMKESASSNIIPQPLDEFKPSKIDKIRLGALYNHFRDAYDGHEGLRGRADQTMVSYQLLAPLVVAGEESADEPAIRERSVELLFSKKDLKQGDHRAAFRRLSAKREVLGDYGRALLMAALATTPDEAAGWHREGLGRINGEFPSRVANNLACCYAGLKLVEKLCALFRLSWSDVFHIDLTACIKYLEYGASEYLLDGGNSNKSIVEETFEIMSRMELTEGVDFDVSGDGGTLYIRLLPLYDRYTKYRRDYAISGEVLPYGQFRKQLKHSDLLIQANTQHKFKGENNRCYAVDLVLLRERCDVPGFGSNSPKPLI